MDTREGLNSVYRPLHEMGCRAVEIIRSLGYKGKLGYYNLHEVKVNGKYETEYFPLPEIEMEGIGLGADLGISLDGGAWLEARLSREAALAMDYEKLAQAAPLEVYGAEDYWSDFYHAGMKAEETAKKIEASNEQKIQLCFTLKEWDEEELEKLLSLIKK